MRETDFDKLVNSLLGGETPRVWSLLVTMFGDLALAPGARLSGASVNALTATIGLKPEATRVALHRLRKEGWIESHRTGRQTRYELTKEGRRETQAAWPRVYGPDPVDRAVQLVLEDPSERTRHDTARGCPDTVQLGAKSWITTRPVGTSGQWSIPLSATEAPPHWVSERICAPEVQAASQELAEHFRQVAEKLTLAEMTLLQSVALRVVIVHEWRRLVLRVPHFPERLFPDGWHGAACRAVFQDLLGRLTAPDLTDLETHVEAA
jgi:phenylacetic acid degradation operon negative regulatory protein